MTSPSQSFDGLRVRDKTGKDTTSATVVVSRKGVKLSGARGTLGNFPFQSITSWSHAADDALSLVVTVNDARREVILAGPPPVVAAVLQAIDSTVNDILRDMTESPASQPAAAAYTTPAPSPAEPARSEGAATRDVPKTEHVSETDAAVADAARANRAAPPSAPSTLSARSPRASARWQRASAPSRRRRLRTCCATRRALPAALRRRRGPSWRRRRRARATLRATPSPRAPRPRTRRRMPPPRRRARGSRRTGRSWRRRGPWPRSRAPRASRAPKTENRKTRPRRPKTGTCLWTEHFCRRRRAPTRRVPARTRTRRPPT